MNPARDQIVETMRGKLQRRDTDSPQGIGERAQSAPDEMQVAHTYTHRLLNSASEDNTDELGQLGTFVGEKCKRRIDSFNDLGPNARWLVDTFVKILNGEMPPGDYSPNAS